MASLMAALLGSLTVESLVVLIDYVMSRAIAYISVKDA